MSAPPQPQLPPGPSAPPARPLARPLVRLRRVTLDIFFLSLVALALVAVLACGVPWAPVVITSSYEYQVHLAHVMRCQWGVDLASTYGPWGFVGLSSYHPETFSWMIFLNGLILSITALRIGVFATRTLPSARWAKGLLVAACLLPLTPLVAPEWTPMLFCAQVLSACVVLEWLTGRCEAFQWIDALAAATLGFLALVKISVWPVVLVVSIASWLRPGRRCAFTACLGAGILVSWLSAGQSLRHLGAFVRTGVDVIAGYKNGLTSWYPEPLTDALFVGAVLGLMAFLAWIYPPKTLSTLVALLTLGAIFAQLFEGGFVRADLYHIGPNVLAVLSLVPLLLAAVWAAGTWKGPVAALGMVFCSAALFWLSPGVPDYERPRREARALLRLLRDGTRPLLVQREAELAELGATNPLGVNELAGIGGILGGDIGILEGNHARFTLQPTLTSYSSYTPSLQSLNAAWIERPDGLAWLLWCSPGAEGFYYPTETDSRALVALLSHFTFARQVGQCALLRRTVTEPLMRASPQRQAFPLGQVVTLGARSAGLVWAEFTVQETLLGKLIRGFLKPAPLSLQVRLRDGRSVIHPVLPTMISQGFLLSPYPSSWQTLEAAARGSVTGDSVAALQLGAWSLGSSPSGLFYEPEVQVTLTTLSKPQP